MCEGFSAYDIYPNWGRGITYSQLNTDILLEHLAIFDLFPEMTEGEKQHYVKQFTARLLLPILIEKLKEVETLRKSLEELYYGDLQKR